MLGLFDNLFFWVAIYCFYKLLIFAVDDRADMQEKIQELNDKLNKI